MYFIVGLIAIDLAVWLIRNYIGSDDHPLVTLRLVVAIAETIGEVMKTLSFDGMRSLIIFLFVIAIAIAAISLIYGVLAFFYGWLVCGWTGFSSTFSCGWQTLTADIFRLLGWG